MRTTIDSAGRIRIPKPILDELALGSGQVVEVAVVDGRIEIDIPPTPMHLERRVKGLVAVPDVPLPPLTDELVRKTLEKVRR